MAAAAASEQDDEESRMDFRLQHDSEISRSSSRQPRRADSHGAPGLQRQKVECTLDRVVLRRARVLLAPPCSPAASAQQMIKAEGQLTVSPSYRHRSILRIQRQSCTSREGAGADRVPKVSRQRHPSKNPHLQHAGEPAQVSSSSRLGKSYILIFWSSSDGSRM